MRKLLLFLSISALAVGLLASPLSAQQWPNHKMHFPQLPDLIGWDVNATSSYPPPGQGITLADDWQCSESGPVEDIHFWGSWKDQDGNPITDDFESIMPWFTLRIWSNNPGPPSRPDVMLWEWMGEIPGAPFEPPTLEGWYDPSVIEYLLVNNDHVPYWRYDFILPPGTTPFFQEQDSIYWLSITANLFNPALYQWGWKNSRDHFMDDAVWLDPTGMWQPIDEPPRYNIFSGYFDLTGQAWDEDSISTNYYGDGWYYYPSGWWNIWFYDNPFSYDNTKSIAMWVDARPGPYFYIPGDVDGNGLVNMADASYLQAHLDGTGPAPPYTYPGTGFYAAADANGSCTVTMSDVTYIMSYVQGGPPPTYCPTYPPSTPSITFAINYSTDLWSIEGVPGRPPLPGDPENYIVRDTLSVVIGSPEFYNLTIPYNPEWVSIDVQAIDVIVNGWIEHECVTTSLDLAFVITGPEEDIPTLNEWGMLILALLLLTAGTIAVIRRRKTVTAEN
jgi:hypothetical protein